MLTGALTRAIGASSGELRPSGTNFLSWGTDSCGPHSGEGSCQVGLGALQETCLPGRALHRERPLKAALLRRGLRGLRILPPIMPVKSALPAAAPLTASLCLAPGQRRAQSRCSTTLHGKGNEEKLLFRNNRTRRFRVGLATARLATSSPSGLRHLRPHL